MPETKPVLSLPRILEMDSGFLGLQQGNIAPIYSDLGASEASLPLLQLAAPLHAACLVLTAIGMLWLPHVTSKGMLFVPAIGIGIGIGWASIMGNPYVILAGSIPPERSAGC